MNARWLVGGVQPLAANQQQQRKEYGKKQSVFQRFSIRIGMAACSPELDSITQI